MTVTTHIRKSEGGRAAGIIGAALGAFVALMPLTPAWPQATLLPNAVQQWIDGNGNPLASGSVYHYVPGTTQTKTVWQNSGQTIPWSNPITLNAAGEPSSAAGVYGSGSYRQIVYDSLGNLLYDALTASTGTSSASGTAGDGMPLGFVMPFFGITAPDGYVFAYGQAISRTTYADFMTATTISTTASCTSGSATISSIADTSQMGAGKPIEASCLPPGTTIATVAANSITVSALATATATPTIRVFPNGNGNGATTFNVPDLRGDLMYGRANMGGTPRGNLTSTYYGISPNALGMQGGGGESHTLSQAELPAFKPALTSVVTDPSHSHSQSGNTLTSTGGNNGQAGADFARSASVLSTAAATTGITVATTFNSNLGSATPFSVLPSGITINYVIKVSANSGTFNIAVANNTIMGNNSGSTAAPVPITMSAGLDMICSTRGALLERTVGGWVCLTPGTSGQVVASNGVGADPSYQTVTASGSITLQGDCTGGGLSTVTIRCYPPASIVQVGGAITLTTGLGLVALSDGQEFVFTPTATVVGALPTLAVDSVAAKNIKSTDGYSYAVNYDVQKNKPLRVRYNLALDVFVIQSAPMQWEDLPFGHGTVKLQASTATSISLTQEDGQGLLIWNATTGAFRMVRLDSITVSNIFAGNTTYVNGTPNLNLADNQLYSVYVNNTDPTNQNANRLEFWASYLGVGTVGWIPTINELGIYTKSTTAGGSTADNTRTFVGTVMTGVGTVETVIAPAATMCSRVYPHFAKNRWKFGYQTTVVSNVTSSSSFATQTTPSICSSTEGISDSPRFDAKATVTCDTSGVTASFRIAIAVLAFNGVTATVNSPTYTVGIPYANAPVHVSASWESAPSMGFLTAKTDIATSGGSCTFATDILGHISQ